MKKYFKDVSAIVWKDTLSEFRTREMLISMFMLAVLILIIFIFSIHLGKVKAIDVAPGVLWIAIIFAGTIGLNRSFLNEKENDCIFGIMSMPIDRSAIYFGKTDPKTFKNHTLHTALEPMSHQKPTDWMISLRRTRIR